MNMEHKLKSRKCLSIIIIMLISFHVNFVFLHYMVFPEQNNIQNRWTNSYSSNHHYNLNITQTVAELANYSRFYYPTTVRNDIIEISNGVKFHLHRFRNDLFMNLTTNPHGIWFTYPMWYKQDTIAMQFNTIRTSTIEIKHHFDSCLLLNIHNYTQLYHGKMRTSFKKIGESDRYRESFCKFEKESLNQFKFGEKLIFIIYGSESKVALLFDVPQRLFLKPKHFLSVYVHKSIFGNPPLFILKSFVEYYVFHGATQFVFYDMQSDYYSKIIDMIKSINVANNNSMIDIYLYNASLTYLRTEQKGIGYKKTKGYGQQFWVIRNIFILSKLISIWNIVVDLDELFIPMDLRKYPTILDLCISLQKENQIDAICVPRYRFAAESCLKSLDLGINNQYTNISHMEQMVFRKKNKTPQSEGKLMYKTSNNIARIGMHRIFFRQNKERYQSKNNTYIFAAHLRRIGDTYHICKNIINEQDLFNRSIKRNGEEILNRKAWCIDQSALLPKQLRNSLCTKNDVCRKWKC